jgi:hypothetical protein
MSSLRKLFMLVVLALTALAFAASASANSQSSSASATSQGFSFNAWPQVSFVQAGQSTLINYYGKNGTTATRTCVLLVNSDYLTNWPAWSGTLAPGQDFGGSIGTGVLNKNAKISFGLWCDGYLVGSRDVNVKIRPSGSTGSVQSTWSPSDL